MVTGTRRTLLDFFLGCKETPDLSGVSPGISRYGLFELGHCALDHLRLREKCRFEGAYVLSNPKEGFRRW